MARLKISKEEHARRIREGKERARAARELAAQEPRKARLFKTAVRLPKRRVSQDTAARLQAFAAVLQALAPLSVADARKLLETALGLLP